MPDKDHLVSSVSFRVYVEDTDLMGIMYHANYLRFFERARTEMFRERGWSLTALAEKNFHFAIHTIDIKYIAPARLDDVLTLNTAVVERSKCGLLFEQTMQNQDNRLLCKAMVHVVCVNGQMKPQRLPFI